MSGWGAAAGTNLANPDTERSAGLGRRGRLVRLPGAPPTAGQWLRPRCAPGFTAMQRRLHCGAGPARLCPRRRGPPAAGGRRPPAGVILTARNIGVPGAGLAGPRGTFPCPLGASCPGASPTPGHGSVGDAGAHVQRAAAHRALDSSEISSLCRRPRACARRPARQKRVSP